MEKTLNILKYVLLLAGAATLIPMISNSENVDLMLNCGYLFLGLAIVSTVVLTAMNFGKDSNGSKVGLFVFAALAVVVVLCYFVFSSDAVVLGSDGTAFDVSTTLKWTDTLLYTTYISFAALVVLLVFGEIRNSFK